LTKGAAPARSTGPRGMTKPAVIQQIIRLRKQRGLSQSQFGKRMKVSQPAVSKLESGRIWNVQLGTLQRAADALESPITIRIKPRRLFPTGKKVTLFGKKAPLARRKSISPTGKPRGS
jgi:transcriptional regulator with XRE-family HTH domain